MPHTSSRNVTGTNSARQQQGTTQEDVTEIACVTPLQESKNTARVTPRATSRTTPPVSSGDTIHTPIRTSSRAQIRAREGVATPERNRRASSRIQRETGVPTPPASSGMARETLGNSTVHELPHTIFPSIFRDGTTDVARLRNVINDLRFLQHMTDGRHRFHLFLESEQGECSSPTSERFEHVVTRVLFSPSIALEQLQEGSDFQALVRMLNGISWQGASRDALRFNENSSRRRRTTIQRPNNSGSHSRHRLQSGTYHPLVADHNMTQEGEQPVRDAPIHSNAPFYGQFTLSVTRRPLPDCSVANWFACHRNDLAFPTWFPFQDKEYTSGPQVTGEPLYVRPDAANNFDALDIPQIHWIYRELFEFLFREAKRKKRRGVPTVFKYACFTPPWFRSQIIKGERGNFANQSAVYFTTVVIPDLRNQRSRMGATRLAYILGAFLQYEPDMTRKPLIHLIRVVPRNPTMQKRKARSLVGYMQPLPSNTLRNITSLRRSSMNENDDAGRAISNTRTEGAVVNSQRQHQQQQRDQNDASPRPSSGNREQSGFLNRTGNFQHNGRNETLRTPPRRLAWRIEEEPIDLENEGSNDGSHLRNVRRRIEFPTTSPPDAGTIGEHSRTRRRRIPRLFSPENSEDEIAPNITSGAELSNDESDQEKEPFEDDGSLDNEEEMHKSAPSSPTIRQRGRSSTVRVVCAFDQECRFKDASMMQEERFMLMRCTKCFRKMHDLCAGGEHGESMCSICKESQTRNEISLA